MAGVTHPFFGNQYTNGGYAIGSFKFPEGLTREVGERIVKISVPDTALSSSNVIPSVRTTAPLTDVVKTGAKSKWIIPTLIVAAIVAAGGYLAYRYFKKKGLVKIPNVGVCEHCGEPLTGATFVLDNDTPYIVCKKCGEKNYAKYLSDENSEIPNGDEKGCD
ncbi:MAG: hypothetical protein LBN05_02565 [Oscillospiraceae bacterium]|jgi:DNA-directed RNA polymerase subunit RPC12/RpoP|nr:hypothetical protein [Oscillospiraceae bacterium]